MTLPSGLLKAEKMNEFSHYAIISGKTALFSLDPGRVKSNCSAAPSAGESAMHVTIFFFVPVALKYTAHILLIMSPFAAGEKPRA